MDLGTANTIIMQDNQVIIDEPSVVAIRTADDTAVAVGKKASAMIDTDNFSFFDKKLK